MAVVRAMGLAITSDMFATSGGRETEDDLGSSDSGQIRCRHSQGPDPYKKPRARTTQRSARNVIFMISCHASMGWHESFRPAWPWRGNGSPNILSV